MLRSPGLLALALFVSPAWAQVPGISREEMWPAPTAEDWTRPCLITWQRSWEDALAVSRATGKPIMAAVNMDGEIASEHWAGIRYREPATARLYEPYVCVIASVYRHNPRDYDEEGGRILCPRFGSVTCGEHIRIEPILYEEYFEGKRIAPRHIGIELDRVEQYDVYYAFDIDSVRNAVETFILERPDTELPDTRGDRSLLDLVESADVADRVAVEEAFAAGGFATRRDLLERVRVTPEVDHIDLLRRALFSGDEELSNIAFGLLCEASSERAVDLIADVLRYPLSEEEKLPLLEALDRLGEDWPRARDIATVHRGLGVAGGAVDPSAWEREGDGAPVGSASYAGHLELQARLERTLAAGESEPEDPAAQLDMAASFLALAVRPEASRRRARVLLEDADRAAKRAEELGAEGWRVDSLIGLTSHYLGRRGDAHRRIERAVAELPPGLEDWNSMAVLSLFANSRQSAIRRAARRREHWPAEWLTDLHGARQVLLHHPFGTDASVVSHYDFLGDLGAGAQASEVLDAGLERYPDSWALHDRLRARCLENEALGGLGGLEATYDALLARENASPSLPWFAGYASFVAAEYYRRAGELVEAEAAYSRAIGHYEEAISRRPESRASSEHYIALALAARARLALEREDLRAAHTLMLESFQRCPSAAGALDGLNLTPVMTATTLLGRLEASGIEELAGSLRGALAGLPAEALQLPEFEAESRGQGPSPDARRSGRSAGGR